MIKSVRASLRVVILVTGLIFWAYIMFFSHLSDEKKLESHIATFSPNTSYRLVSDKGNRTVSSGTLADFYSCLKKYRSPLSKIGKKGNTQHYKLWLNKFTYIWISSVNGEALLFNMYTKLDNEDNFTSSEVYAINCRLSLLGTVTVK
ncbi:hypothetical protein [Agarivorans sp. DSG3-1]|uniref:hypothetical protein n=1 Tax=Agarivorans sp. DSG3-1 TaxID=3342249 RepID=UPI00398EB3D6